MFRSCEHELSSAEFASDIAAREALMRILVEIGRTLFREALPPAPKADKILQIREKGMDRAYREEVPPSAQRFDIHTITGEMVRRYEEMLEQHP